MLYMLSFGGFHQPSSVLVIEANDARAALRRVEHLGCDPGGRCDIAKLRGLTPRDLPNDLQLRPVQGKEVDRLHRVLRELVAVGRIGAKDIIHLGHAE